MSKLAKNAKVLEISEGDALRQRNLDIGTWVGKEVAGIKVCEVEHGWIGGRGEGCLQVIGVEERVLQGRVRGPRGGSARWQGDRKVLGIIKGIVVCFWRKPVKLIKWRRRAGRTGLLVLVSRYGSDQVLLLLLGEHAGDLSLELEVHGCWGEGSGFWSSRRGSEALKRMRRRVRRETGVGNKRSRGARGR